MGTRLQALHPRPFARVYSSPLRRARLTARLAGFADPSITDLLRECDYGVYEGLTTEQIHQQRPGWELYRDGSPGGESSEAIYARARAFINSACKGPEREDVIAFAHGHIIRAIAAAFLDLPLAHAAQLALDTAAASILREGERGRLLQLWNLTEPPGPPTL